jgi:hypothetical protein
MLEQAHGPERSGDWQRGLWRLAMGLPSLLMIAVFLYGLDELPRRWRWLWISWMLGSAALIIYTMPDLPKTDRAVWTWCGALLLKTLAEFQVVRLAKRLEVAR